MTSSDDLRQFVASLPGARDVDQVAIDHVLRDFATVVPPEYSYTSELITMNSTGGGVSRKPGNILLNWRRLFDVGPDVGVAVVGAVGQNAFVVSLIALYIWNKVWRGSESPLTEAEASVIEALWSNGAGKRTIESEDGYRMTNELRVRRSAVPLSRAEFEAAIDVLTSMQCVEVTGDKIWLREWVRKKT